MINQLLGFPNADDLVYRSQRNSFLHPNYLRKQPKLPSSRSWCALSSISSLYHPWRHHMLIQGRSLWEKSPPACLRHRNVYLPRLYYWSCIFRQPCSFESSCVFSVCSPILILTYTASDMVYRYLYYVIYTLGYIGIPFLYASEVAPVQLRAAICGVLTAVSWLFNFLVN